MGTWNVKILDNDISSEVYEEFYQHYNSNLEPSEIIELMTKNHSYDSEEVNNFWFALALASWETKSLPINLLKKVREIIKTESDLKIWKRLDADESTLLNRKNELNEFLVKLESKRNKSTKRKKTKVKTKTLPKGTCLTFRLPDNNYGGCIVLSEWNDDAYPSYYNLIATLKMSQKKKPTISDFENTEVLIKNFGNWNNKPEIKWVTLETFNKYKDSFENIGQISINTEFNNAFSTYRTCAYNWTHIYICVEYQLNFEREEGIKPISSTINKFFIDNAT